METLEDMILEMKPLKRYGPIKSIARLGGLTNRVFRVETAEGVYCLRLPGEGTEEYINRGSEGVKSFDDLIFIIHFCRPCVCLNMSRAPRLSSAGKMTIFLSRYGIRLKE